MTVRKTSAIVIVLASVPLASGCIVRTAADIVTAPVKIASKTVDLVTTSQSEADEKRGRGMRNDEERLGELERSYRKHRRDCDRGDRRACDRAREDYREIRYLLPDK